MTKIPLFSSGLISPEQRNHGIEIQNKFHSLLEQKYTKGCLEHGGNLWEMSALELLDNAIAETVDQFTYLHTLREKLLADH